MKKKPSRRGLLTGLIKYPKGPHHKKTSVAKSVLKWVFGGLLAVVLVGMFATFVLLQFFPGTATRSGEGDFKVTEVIENPPGYLPEEQIVAVARVVIEGLRVAIPLKAADRAGVVKDAQLHVRYTYNPRMSRVVVEEWRVRR
jgi:hypothetical protein